ncbi:MAG: N-6 DNA methylase, partial [Candidatus Sumerlaeota bacterium]|nr:N-6 DNA methylase [Candidatus Sumerlaeota bacterium]
MIKPTHKAIQAYYKAMQGFDAQDVHHETGVRAAFQTLLADVAARERKWTLIAELSERAGPDRVVPDGTLRDSFQMPRGYWEAKDTDDDLDVEIRKKIALKYPTTNIVFEDTRQGVLYQDGQERQRADLSKPQELADLLNRFLSYSEPNIEEFEKAVEAFKERVPELARGLIEKIQQAHRDNRPFIAAFQDFFALCQGALNPNISQAAVDEMLAQHLLTERLFRTIFENEEFTRRNVIAAEVEKVIAALVSRGFSRAEFLKSLDRFYMAIEDAARRLDDFAEKQHFLNTVYERFFQGYSVKVADTHGIVYTPQPVVDFMCASVEEVLKTEFGKALSSPDVCIIDPCTGTGNFIVNLLRRIPRRDLPRMYREQMFANEVMLMPYYIASMNIEHAYWELAGEWEAFEGLCFVDTLDLAEAPQRDFVQMLSEKNTERVQRQKSAPITVIIGNPPYNVGQLNENDNNKNRKYAAIEKEIKFTYAKDSKATNKNALSDAYVKFFRWATDRLEGRDGIVCFISNNGFFQGLAFDGFRKHLAKDFGTIYHFDLKGNARTAGERRKREGGNIFHDMIRCGVGITFLVRKKSRKSKRVLYHVVEDFWPAGRKEAYLRSFPNVRAVPWRALAPDVSFAWVITDNRDAFARFLTIGSKVDKAQGEGLSQSISKTYGRGVATCRDSVVYDYGRDKLAVRVRQFIDDYNGEVD